MEREIIYKNVNKKGILNAFSETDQKRYILFFILLFYILAICKFANEMWLFQNPPFAFRLYFDVSLWFFLQTGIHQIILDNHSVCLLFDAVFYTLPVLYYFTFLRKSKFSIWLAAFMLVFNCVYVWLYTVYPITSTESQIAWLFTPLLLMNRRIQNFHLWMQILRYIFIFFFFSAGVWKIVQGGLWETEEMSGILLQQHKELLATGANNW